MQSLLDQSVINNKNNSCIPRDIRHLVRKMTEWKRKRGDRRTEPESQSGAHRRRWLAGWRAEGLLFQSGTGLDEPVYSVTVSDIPFSYPKKSPLKNGSAGE